MIELLLGLAATIFLFPRFRRLAVRTALVAGNILTLAGVVGTYLFFG